MSGKLVREVYLTISLAVVFGLYWPWAEMNDFALRPFTEGTAVWLAAGLAPVAMADWLGSLIAWLRGRLKALVRLSFSTYP